MKMSTLLAPLCAAAAGFCLLTSAHAEEIAAAQALLVPPLALPPLMAASPQPAEPNASVIEAMPGTEAREKEHSAPAAIRLDENAPDDASDDDVENTKADHANDAASFTPTREGFEFNLWQSASLVGGLLLLLAGGGALLVRFKKRGLLPSPRHEKAMQIAGTLSIAPKRQLLIVKVKGEEFVISNTEHGVNFLTRLGNEGAHAVFAAADAPSARAQPVSARSEGLRTALSGAQSLSPASDSTIRANASPSPKSAPEPKSEILLSALRSLREKGTAKSPARKSVESASDAGETPTNRPRPANESVLPRERPASQGTGNAFPRYLAKAFAEEGRRNLDRDTHEHGGAAAARAANEEVQVESVTNLIREKLRDMKPLA